MSCSYHLTYYSATPLASHFMLPCERLTLIPWRQIPQEALPYSDQIIVSSLCVVLICRLIGSSPQPFWVQNLRNQSTLKGWRVHLQCEQCFCAAPERTAQTTFLRISTSPIHQLGQSQGTEAQNNAVEGCGPGIRYTTRSDVFSH